MSTDTREALAELVALKDLKERAEACWPDDPEGASLLREYSSRKDAAWANARAALATQPAQPSDEAECERATIRYMIDSTKQAQPSAHGVAVPPDGC